MLFFEQYKTWIIVAGAVLYSFFVWNVSDKYHSYQYEKEKQETLSKILETTKKNQELSNTLGTTLETGLAKLQQLNKTIVRDVHNEVSKERIYRDCHTTPNGMRIIEQAIDGKSITPSK